MSTFNFTSSQFAYSKKGITIMSVDPQEMQEKIGHRNIRGVETVAGNRIDSNNRLLQEIKKQGRIEQAEARIAGLKNLYAVQKQYLADTRKELAFTFSKRALTVLVSELVSHDEMMNAKARALNGGRDLAKPFDTFSILERAIESAEARILGTKPVVLDPVSIAKRILVEQKFVRFEKMGPDKVVKVRKALNMNQVKACIAHEWKMQTA